MRAQNKRRLESVEQQTAPTRGIKVIYLIREPDGKVTHPDGRTLSADDVAALEADPMVRVGWWDIVDPPPLTD